MKSQNLSGRKIRVQFKLQLLLKLKFFRSKNLLQNPVRDQKLRKWKWNVGFLWNLLPQKRLKKFLAKKRLKIRELVLNLSRKFFKSYPAVSTATEEAGLTGHMVITKQKIEEDFPDSRRMSTESLSSQDSNDSRVSIFSKIFCMRKSLHFSYWKARFQINWNLISAFIHLLDQMNFISV